MSIENCFDRFFSAEKKSRPKKMTDFFRSDFFRREIFFAAKILCSRKNTLLLRGFQLHATRATRSTARLMCKKRRKTWLLIIFHWFLMILHWFFVISGTQTNVLKNSPGPRKSRPSRVQAVGSPSSVGVRIKTGYLGLPTWRDLSRKLVFRKNYKIFYFLAHLASGRYIAGFKQWALVENAILDTQFLF